MSPATRTVAIAAAVAAMVAGGFAADRMLLRDDAAAGTSSGEPLQPLRQAPTIELPGLDDAPIALADYAGRPILVNFWATWCKPCRKEIPLLIELRGEYAAQGFEVIGIAIDEMEPTRRLAAELGVDYPVMVGEQEGIDALVAFGAPTTALPYTAALDRNGRIVAEHVGELTREDALALLNRIL
jgi:thiol-disulfide isomerase/thioredoxin